MRKLISLLLTMCLVSSNLVYAQSVQKNIPLSQVQAQAKQDIKKYQATWGAHAKEVLLPVLPLTLALDLQAEWYSAELVDLMEAIPTLSSKEQAPLLRLADLLNKHEYYEASHVFDIISSNSGWYHILDEHPELEWLPEYIDEFLGETVPKSIALGKAPASDFYIGLYDDDFVRYYIADLEVGSEYNTIRDLLTLIEENQSKLSSDEIIPLLRRMSPQDVRAITDKTVIIPKSNNNIFFIPIPPPF